MDDRQNGHPFGNADADFARLAIVGTRINCGHDQAAEDQFGEFETDAMLGYIAFVFLVIPLKHIILVTTICTVIQAARKEKLRAPLARICRVAALLPEQGHPYMHPK